MAQTEFTGKNMTFTWNAVPFVGLTKVEINEEDGPDAEQLDTTVYADTSYVLIADPLGSKGDDKTTVTVTCWASTASYADLENTKHAFNSAQTGVLDMAAGTANANTYTHTSLELTSRVTEIPFDGYATCTMTFEANALGAWTAPA
jgi:hypothetical protein